MFFGGEGVHQVVEHCRWLVDDFFRVILVAAILAANAATTGLFLSAAPPARKNQGPPEGNVDLETVSTNAGGG